MQEMAAEHLFNHVPCLEHSLGALVVSPTHVGIVEAAEDDGWDTNLGSQRRVHHERQLSVVTERGVETGRVGETVADSREICGRRCPLRRPSSNDFRKSSEVIARKASRRTGQLVGKKMPNSPQFAQSWFESTRMRDRDGDRLSHLFRCYRGRSVDSRSTPIVPKRIVYLGAVAPQGSPASAHLGSRLAVGEVLRTGSVKTIELRASMIVGYGSLSWLIVRDLAARLPLMVLPRWLKSRTQPVAIDDIVVALVRALDLPIETSTWFDVPGPEVLSGKEILEETSRAMGLKVPRMIEVPLLTPQLSSLWVRLVTRAKWSVAREVVVGLTDDLLARDDRFWTLINHSHRLKFSEAARIALEAERREGPIGGTWGAIERALQPLER